MYTYGVRVETQQRRNFYINKSLRLFYPRTDTTCWGKRQYLSTTRGPRGMGWRADVRAAPTRAIPAIIDAWIRWDEDTRLVAPHLRKTHQTTRSFREDDYMHTQNPLQTTNRAHTHIVIENCSVHILISRAVPRERSNSRAGGRKLNVLRCCGFHACLGSIWRSAIDPCDQRTR